VSQTFGLTLKTNIVMQAGCLLIHDMIFVLGECMVENRPLRWQAMCHTFQPLTWCI